MATNVLKAILIGLLMGVLLFFMPFFLVRVLAVILIISLIFRLSGFRRRWPDRFSGYGFWNERAYMQQWYSMSDDEKKTFKEKMEKELFANPGNSK